MDSNPNKNNPEQPKHGFFGRLRRALGGHAYEQASSDIERSSFEMSSLELIDNDSPKVLDIIPGQDGYLLFNALMPKQPGDKTLLVYMDRMYYLRFGDAKNEDGAAATMAWKIMPSGKDPVSNRTVDYLGGYETSDYTLAHANLEEIWEGEYINLRGRWQSNGRRLLNCIYRLRAAEQPSDSALDTPPNAETGSALGWLTLADRIVADQR